MRKELGKIQKASFGNGGYQESMIGFRFTLGGAGWGVQDFWGHWSGQVTENTKWTEEQRIKYLGEQVMRMHHLLDQAKKGTLDEMIGVPIEATFEGNTLKEWRILTEVV